MKKLKLISVLIVLINIAFGGVGSAAYHKLGMNARGIAMGRAYTASCAGASAVFWNPANLCRVHYGDKRTLGLLVNNMSNKNYDINYLTSAFALSGENFGMGFGVIQYSISDIPEYDASMNFLGHFANLERSAFFGIATKLANLLNIGISIAYLDQAYDGLSFNTNTETGFSARAGLSFLPFYRYERLLVSASFYNHVVQKLDKVRPSSSAGILWYPKLSDGNYFNQLSLVLELEQENVYPLKFKFGSELLVAEISDLKFYFRFGLDDLDIETRSKDFAIKEDISVNQLIKLNMKTTYGFGLDLPGLIMNNLVVSFNYAFVDECYRDLHFFTFNLWFNKEE